MVEALSDNYTEIVLLCEGKQDEVFMRRFLTGNGVHRHRVRVRPYPAGQGSGSQFVQEEYSKEVFEHRRRANRMNIALIVMQDCDTRTVDERRKTLEQSAAREPNERIALLFPKRNIETWIRFLTDGEAVDETQRYPKLRGRESECHAAADRLASKDEYRLTPDVPDSLRAACAEVQRIFPAKRCVQA